MYSIPYKKVIFAVITVAVCSLGVASARIDETPDESRFRKIVSFIKKVNNPPDYVKAGEWPVEDFGCWTGAPPIPVVVAPTGDVYVASEGHVQYFSSAGSFLGEWEMPISPFRFGYFGLAIARGGAVFAADHSASRVYEFTPRGRLISEWEAEVGPLAVGPNGDIYASTGRRIQRYDVNGTLLAEWGPYGTGEGEFGLALYLAVGPDGTVYVLDYDFGGVQYFTPEGSYLGRWGPEGCRYSRYKKPRGIAVGTDGKVYIFENPRVGVGRRFDYFTAAGSFLGSFGLPENRSTVYGPGIAVAPGGTVFISDRYNQRISCFKPSRIFHVARYGVFGVTALIIVFLITLIARRFLKRRKGTTTR